jgi:hypothetical protein
VIFFSVCFGIGSQNVAIPVIVPSHFNSALGTALLFDVDLNFRKSLLHTLSQFDSSPASGQYSIPIFLDISRYILNSTPSFIYHQFYLFEIHYESWVQLFLQNFGRNTSWDSMCLSGFDLEDKSHCVFDFLFDFFIALSRLGSIA